MVTQSEIVGKIKGFCRYPLPLCYLSWRETWVRQAPSETDECCRVHNKQKIGIVLTDNFEIHDPSPDQHKLLRRVLQVLAASLWVKSSKVFLHKYLVSTRCPRENFHLSRIPGFHSSLIQHLGKNYMKLWETPEAISLDLAENIGRNPKIYLSWLFDAGS